MAVNLSKRSINGYEYIETIADGTNGKSILIPANIENNITCTVIAGSNIGKIQFTTSVESLVLSNNANWQDWPKYEVTGSDYDTLNGKVTALRGVSISGEITIEIAG